MSFSPNTNPVTALWGPQCIQAKQNTSTGYYDLLEFSFDVAPSHYNFDIYWIYITPSSEGVRPVSLKVDMVGMRNLAIIWTQI